MQQCPGHDRDPQAAWNYWVTVRRVLGSWNPGDETTLKLNLANLPIYVDFPPNILEALSDGELELLVEDDTAVDFANLSVCRCHEPRPGPAWVDVVDSKGMLSTEATTWGLLKANYSSEAP